MFIIKNLEVHEVNGDRDRITHYENINDFNFEYASFKDNVKWEEIRGRRFWNSRNEEICIGMSKQIQDLLGLPFNSFEKMEKEIDEKSIANILLKQKNISLQLKIDRYKNMTFIQKLKNLFKRGL